MTQSQECAAAVIAQLVAQGVTELVLSPGSRSAPLALAAVAAENAGLLRLHVRVDERGAGFLALGLGKASGQPAAIVTTSGTAVGNLLPAVMEASHAGVPLLVVTADRPAALVGLGANQTTEQHGLFERYVRWSATLDWRDDPRSWHAQAARGVLACQGAFAALPGPVHLNVHLGLPLVSHDPVTLPAAEPRRYQRAGAATAVELPPGPRTVVIAGDASPAAGRRVAAMCARAQVPLLAEPSSNARLGTALTAGDVLLDSPLSAGIERVVVYGHPTLSRSVGALLGRPDVEIVVEGSPAGWPDAGWQATLFASEITLPAGDSEWAAQWARADAARLAQSGTWDVAPAARDAGGVLRDAPDAGQADSGTLTGPAVAAAVWASIPADAPLVVGSSSPIRDLGRAPVGPTSPSVYANRGLAGIDGTLSTALGVALATSVPTTLYCGDLTFVHDVTALAAGAAEPCGDLRVVVADDHGGSLFARLEYGDPAFADVFERIFATPTGPRVAGIARGFGVPVREVASAAELAAALASPPTGVEVLVVALPAPVNQ